MDLDEIVARMRSSDPAVQLRATTQLRNVLSVPDAPIQAVIDAIAVPRLIEFLQSPDEEMQYEAAMAVTNLVCGSSEQTLAVVNAGAVPCLVRLLSSHLETVREQAVWALGNITADSIALRDLVLSFGALPLLLGAFEGRLRPLHVRMLVWTLANLCRGKPLPVGAERAVPVLVPRLDSNNTELLASVCDALSALVDVPMQERHPSLLDPNLLLRMAALVEHKAEEVRTPARAFGRRFAKWLGFEISCALQDLSLPAPLLCEIIESAVDDHFVLNLPFHDFWNVVVAVKHFRK